MGGKLDLPGVPAPVARAVQGRARRLPLPLPSAAQWVEAGSHPAVMDTTRARTLLGWRPRYTALEALQDALR